MDQVVKAIKLCSEFIIGILIVHSYTRDLKEYTPFTMIPMVIRAMFIILAFEFAFYWHVLR